MSLLSEQERNQLEDDLEQQIGKNAFDALEAAILAKLASAELPPLPAYECGPHTGHAAVRTDESIRAYGHQAHAQGFAAGAAAQLSAEPVGCVVVNGNNKVGMLRAQLDIEAGEMIYTRREA